MMIFLELTNEIDFNVIDSNKGNPQVEGQNPFVLKYPCSSKTDCTGYIINLDPGSYFLEVWGASGSTGTDHQNSFPTQITSGGYTSGTIRLNSKTTIYSFIGAMPPYGSVKGGYNGGGDDTCTDSVQGSGGGASDFRLIGVKWDDEISLLSRFLVAGGSAGSHIQPWGRGGEGGGLEGSDAYIEGNYKSGYTSRIGRGGTQQDGGKATGSASTSKCTKGSFGKGGNGFHGGGGGSGWYGGGGGYDGIGGGGGSSFVWTEEYKNNVPPNYNVPTEYFLTNYSIKNGKQTFPSVFNTAPGNYGNGIARITILTLQIIQKSCATTIITPYHYLFYQFFLDF